MPYIVRTDADGKKEYSYTARSGKRDKSTKEAVERLRGLVNADCKDMTELKKLLKETV